MIDKDVILPASSDITAWEKLARSSQGTDPPERSVRIKSSHVRCESCGVNRTLTEPRKRLRGARLRELLHRDAQLIGHSNLLFSEITSELGDTNRLLLVADHDCHVVHLVSNPRILESISQHSGVEVGVSLAETSCGTNAVSMALRYREPFVLYSDEHYCSMFSGWCCVAVPILSSNGKPVAAVQIGGEDGPLVSINLLLAKLIARELQNLCYLGSISADYDVGGESGTDRGTDPAPNLTDRQLEVLELYANGLSYKQIARQLNLSSVKTVSEHLDAARKKLSASTRRQAIEKGVALGLFDEL